MSKRSIIWRWATARAPRTWIAHGLVSLLGATVFGLGYGLTDNYVRTLIPDFVAEGSSSLAQAIGATVMLLYFLFKEMGDELKHQATGEWRKPKWQGVTPEVDQVGDLVGPVFVAAATWAMWAIGKLN